MKPPRPDHDATTPADPEQTGGDERDAWRRDLAAALREIEQTSMPFGRFGPAHFPPHGVPIYDLPFEYLAYFAARGFPSGRLGELLRVVYGIKAEGADRAFEPLRARRGGRTRLVPPRTPRR